MPNAQFLIPKRSTQRSAKNPAESSQLSALSFQPNAQCPMPNAQCPILIDRQLDARFHLELT